MSSSPSAKQRSPKRTQQKRKPLQEQSASRANEISSRMSREPWLQEDLDYNNATLFPTKASQVLLPSTLRKKKSYGLSPRSDNFGFLSDSDAGGSTVSRSSQGSRPAVKLKRSVRALRDLYEAQAEESSRPSTATSPPPRPSTANSFRLRSLSSSESISRGYGWDSLRRISNDDLALLPSLPAGRRAIHRASSRNSLSSTVENAVVPSSPNYNSSGAFSSPLSHTLRHLHGPLLEAFEDPPSTTSGAASSSSPNIVRLAHTSSSEQLQSTDQSSSPNIVRLGRSSSTGPLDDSEQSSSPNVIKLGTSSPSRSPRAMKQLQPREFAHSRSSSSSSRKRKRSETEGRSFAARIGATNIPASSPPQDHYITSSVPGSTSSPPIDSPLPSSVRVPAGQNSDFDETSPVIRILGRDHLTSEISSLAGTHSNLQAALSSSPPSIQYPVVRAPRPNQRITINVPKRNSRSMSTEGTAPRFSSTLSAVPSEGSWYRSRPASGVSQLSSAVDDLSEYLHSDELAPASLYILNEAANQTQIRLVTDPSTDSLTDSLTESRCDYAYDFDQQSIDSHHGEANDEVSALPRSEYGFKPAPLRPNRGDNHTNYFSSGSSLAPPATARLNSMKSFTHLRRNSFLRPSSSSSSIHSTLPVPSWARRYYSGVYRDSFQYLYASGSYASLKSLAARQAPIPVSTFSPAPSRPDIARPGTSASLRSIHKGMSDRIDSLLRPKRPKIEPKKSHTLPGVGPLVSNPITRVLVPAATAARPFSHGARRSSYQHPQTQSAPQQRPPRAVSMPFHPADPRAHWAGVVEIHECRDDDGRGATYAIRHHSYTYSASGSQSDSQNQSVVHQSLGNDLRRSWHRWSSSPHLHHDARLNTGSSASRGFGFPFNSKSRWSRGVPEVAINGADTSSSMFHLDSRSVQICAFMAGFVMPVTWFVAAFLPLPERPDTFGDIEKQAFRESQHHRAQRQSQQYRTQPMRNDQGQRGHRMSQDPDWDPGSFDILARLRLERHHAGIGELKYQNARWWRNLNRWMCVVGVVVIVVVVVLAILGTKGHW